MTLFIARERIDRYRNIRLGGPHGKDDVLSGTLTMAIFKNRSTAARPKTCGKKKRYRIMLVDDEPANLLVLSSVLEDDYELVCANSANEALKMIAGMPDVEFAAHHL